MRRVLLGCAGLLTAAGLAGGVHGASPWSASYSAYNGLSVAYDGVPVIYRSTLIVTDAEEEKEVFAPGKRRVQVEEQPKAEKLSLVVTEQSDAFGMQMQVSSLDDHRLRIVFEGKLHREAPARLSYTIGYLNANLFSGRPVQVSGGDSKLQNLSAEPPSGYVEPVLADGKASVSFDSRLGQLELSVRSGGEHVSLRDARHPSLRWQKVDGVWRADVDLRDQGRTNPLPWAEHTPALWWGVEQLAIAKDQPVRIEAIITINPDAADRPEATGELILREVDEAATLRAPSTQVIPQPKSADFDGDVWVMPRTIPCEVTQTGHDPRLAAAISRVLEERLGLSINLKTTSGTGATVIRLGEGPDADASVEPSAQWYSNEEGYRLAVDKRGATITAPTARGAFYGLQTLAQMIGATAQGVVCPTGKIEDWPTMGFRGIHLPAAGRDGMELYRRSIERLAAGHKINHMVLQIDRARWDDHPALATEGAITSEMLRELAELCRLNFIEPIPLINIPGHAEWMFQNGQNLHLAEDPRHPYAYCVHLEESHAFIESIIDATIEIFEPKYFHIGHDEVDLRGRFPNPDCPRCADESLADLVLKNIHRYRTYLHARHIEPIIWGDMMLAKEELGGRGGAASAANLEEAQQLRDAMPDDVLIADWHYWRRGSDYPSLKLMHDAGLRTIASPNHPTEGLYHFTHAAHAAGSLGVLQTTWPGYSPEESGLYEPLKLREFAAWVISADYMWSMRKEKPEALPYDVATVFLRTYADTPKASHAGHLADLDSLATISRQALAEYTGFASFRSLPMGEQRLDGVVFDVPSEALVVLGDRMVAEGAVRQATVELNHHASAIEMLNAALWPMPSGTKVATMRVTYAEGGEEVFPLIQGRHTAAWPDVRATLYGPIAWRGEDTALRVTRWTNPHPDRLIETVTFQAGNAGQGWLLAGLTLTR